jgi:hypothetical protein
MSMRLRRVAARSAKRLLSILVMASLFFGSGGVPVVVRISKDRSQPYPCMDNPCGCSSADECWHHCCCHTNREKVAWAREHGVTPPDFVIAAAEKEEKESSAAQACCPHPGCAKCAARAAAAQAASKPGKKARLRFRLVLVDMARRCGNMAQVWSLFGPALPVRLETAWSFDQKVVGRVIEAPVLDTSVPLPPPVPPPKLVLLQG